MTAVAPPAATRRLLRLEDVPSLSQRQVLATHARHLNGPLISLMRLGGYHDVRPVRAEGAWIETSDGRRLLDLVSSYGALNHGHNHPRVVAAARWFDEQGAPDLLKEFPSPYEAALAENLVALAPDGLDSVFLGNSGTEAVECAMKMTIRQHGGRRTRFLYAAGSLHGKTLGSLQVTGREKYREHMPRHMDWPMVPFGDADAVAEVLEGPEGREIAGVILEPIQGEGGVVVPPPGYLGAVAGLCRKNGALLILDEIQTAIGRTGSLFRCTAEGVTPDILCISKSLGGGVASIGATLTRREIRRRAYGKVGDALVHTSTFGGRGRACAVALESLNTAVDEQFAERALENGRWLRAELQAVAAAHPDAVTAIRGEGLMLGVELRTPKPDLPGFLPRRRIEDLAAKYLPGVVGAELLHGHDILASFVLNNPRVLRIYPPLVTDRADLARIPTALDAVLSEGLGRLTGRLLERAVRKEGLRSVLGWLRRW